ncbi:TonB-dependent receptor domain-containing protein [Mucilaginibacter ginkgonis]|uniref:TonB-dependent receptor n=1 Tax=Mucilaginibacter ginkgonis TaxID=2682091 RepID=A0A6I4INX8_9SPHI|nr:TonB-dependent receptor [Mucilaginibacter ginkgonis]QQL49013.1 TonB-dependent receptor [Mucilaginibacter ginkgonis]
MKTLTTALLSVITWAVTLTNANAQAGVKVSGSITNEAGKPADYATVSLLRQKDSTVVKGGLSDADGNYIFPNIKAGSYMIRVTNVGYQKALSAVFTVGGADVKVAAIKMVPASKALSGVTITGTRPLIERKIDRTVLNVENSVLAAGNSAMDILERAPGVTIDKDDNISLKGKQGVTVMINDKLTYLSAAQLATLLRSTDGNTITSVEIITNPSAKYDAAGNSGIINIKLKKNKQSGTNGNISATAAKGAYYRDNTSLSLNHKEGALNFFGNFSRGDNKRTHLLDIDRTVIGTTSNTYFSQSGNMINTNHYNNYRVGADWDMSSKNTLGVVVSGYYNPERDSTYNHTLIGTQPGVFSTYQNTFSGVPQVYRNFALNLNDKWQIDTAGQQLSVDLDYSKFKNSSNAQYDTYIYNANGTSASTPIMLRNQSPSVIDIKTAKADYTKPLTKTLKLEAGVKFSDVKTDNDLAAQRNTASGYVNDATLTNHFIYQEKIDAGYVNFSKSFKNTSIQAGLRAEYTQSMGDLVTTNNVVNRSYLDLFPSLFVNQTIDKNNEIGFNYSRRIDRPGYDNLNPFIFYLDQYTYSQGNPFLKPQYTNSFELNYTFKHTVNVSLGYSRTTDVITQVLLTDTARKATFQTNQNLRVQNAYNFNVNTPYTVTKWWTGNLNFTAFYLGFKSGSEATGTTLSNGVLNAGKVAYQVKATQTFAITKTFKAEVMGDYQSPLIYGYFLVHPQYAIDGGLSKSFADKKLNVKLSVSDIFNMRTNNVTSIAQGSTIDIHQKNDSRVARLTLTYNFGNSKIKARQHETGADAERNRVKTGN